MKDVNRKLATKAIKVRADVELTCFTSEGIDAIKAALIAGKQSNPKANISIKLVAPPLYVMTMQALDKKQGIATLNEAIAKATEVITAKGADERQGGAARDQRGRGRAGRADGGARQGQRRGRRRRRCVKMCGSGPTRPRRGAKLRRPLQRPLWSVGRGGRKGRRGPRPALKDG